ncbi:hypothetical protein PRIPAC_91145 [Pristionchus pacificus]|uniref:Uncharacterized protein n=1 Tax=Pristionchus pacificus TaxID=54126 RepID=A0A454XTT2_PRIPA|nr:hypothetical protein PRIPAC_91145 [Pristionchus pacificus]|eukprot:PDM82856.1 hypothetical protein PRIPAC_37249 [Pristionchus pacificus]
MMRFVILFLALIACTLAMNGQEVKRDDMMGFGDISAIDTLGGIGLGKRSMGMDEGKQLLARYRALLRERNAMY